ncbi:hypothetical protein HYFRA_00001371 [Hymenoscyphus fraxineus]|uniref:ASX DEUBAD domain-containing protein n=1 Tax=Hymenoscyphus fraxineus TaxID=746836 RepID=A0A9N9L7J3_9HELO|nr:hypothetical protein HYFRA_00001371 [Hymenoscyphus fraxineus]
MTRKLKLNTRTKGGRPRKEKDIWDQFEILGSEESIAYREEINIQAILNHPTAQAIFESTDNEKVSALLSSGEITRTVTEFKADGAAGKHDAKWIAEAMVASERRAAGDYDEFLQARFMRDWGDEGGEMLSDSESDSEARKKKKQKLVANSSVLTLNTNTSAPAGNAVSSSSNVNGISPSKKGPQNHTIQNPPSYSDFSELSELGSSPSLSFMNEGSSALEEHANSLESTSNCLQSTEIHDEHMMERNGSVPDSDQDVSFTESPAAVVPDLQSPQNSGGALG